MFDKIQLGFKFASALIKHIADGGAQVEEKDYDARLDVCAECPERTPDWKCGVCKCHLKLKAAWRSEDCPLGKWPLIKQESEPAAAGCLACPKREPAKVIKDAEDKPVFPWDPRYAELLKQQRQSGQEQSRSPEPQNDSQPKDPKSE